jgi:hypothetical protein
LVIGDRPAAGAFGALGAIYFGNERGLKPYEAGALDGDTQAQLQAVLRRLHRLTVTTLRYRVASERAPASREAVSERTALQRALAKEAAADGDMAQLLGELAERLGPRPSDAAQPYPVVLASLLPPAMVPAPPRTAPVPRPATVLSGPPLRPRKQKR